MSDIQFTPALYFPIVIILLTLLLSIYITVIPTESIDENRPLLNSLTIINLLFAIALYLLLYVYNDSMKNNIIQLSLIFTFLIALPITLYNIGVTSLLYSNT